MFQAGDSDCDEPPNTRTKRDKVLRPPVCLLLLLVLLVVHHSDAHPHWRQGERHHQSGPSQGKHFSDQMSQKKGINVECSYCENIVNLQKVLHKIKASFSVL